MIDFLADPLNEPFMQRAFLALLLIGVQAGLLGCWIVLYGHSYAAESVSHSIFPGLVVAALAGLPLIVGGAPALILGALAIALLARVSGVARDTAVAVVVTGFFGLGSLLALSAEAPPRLESILFGDVLAVDRSDLIVAAPLTALVIGSLYLMHGRLLATGFDPGSAASLGARPALTESLLLILLALTALVAVQALGNLLVVALLVGPAATANLLSSRLRPMMMVSTALAIGLSLLGLYLSYYAGTAAGASIALAIVAAYLIAALARWLAGRPIRAETPQTAPLRLP